MKFKNRGKRISLFLLVVLVVAIFLFSDEIKSLFVGKEEADLQVISGQRQETTVAPTQSQQTEPTKQTEPEEEIETSYWYWKGDIYGAVAEEYLTLTKEGVYVLQVTLAGRNPEQETGKYKRIEEKGKTKVRLYREGSQMEGVVDGENLIFDERTYEKTECEPL